MKKEQDGESGKSEEGWINLARTAAIYLKMTPTLSSAAVASMRRHCGRLLPRILS